MTQLKQQKEKKGDIICQHIDYMTICC